MKRFISFFKISNENLNIIKKVFLDLDISYKVVESTFYFEDFLDSFETLKNLSNELFINQSLLSEPFLDLLEEDYMYLIKLYEKSNLKGFVTEKEVLIKTLDNSKTIQKRVLRQYYSDYETRNVIKKFLECNLNTSKASKELYMHRNTLINKIDKFYNETNYDPKNFKDAFILYNIL